MDSAIITLIVKLKNLIKNLKKIYFQTQIRLKTLLKKKIKINCRFSLRNVPHRAHEWIHYFGLKNCEGLLVQPMIGQFKKDEYKSNYIINSNKKLVEKIYKKRIFYSVFLIHILVMPVKRSCFSRLVRKNYGCTHFLVGRDHGLQKFL